MKNQSFVIKEIETFMKKHHYSPTVRELCKIVGWKSPGSAHSYLERMKLKGIITWEADKPRTIRIATTDNDRIE